MIISKPHGALYVAIPKTGSQALSSVFDRALKAEDCTYPAEALHDYHATFREAQEATPELPLENYWTFAFVRNPFDRFVSYCAATAVDFDLNAHHALRLQVEEAREGENRWLLPQSYFLEGVRTVYRFEQINEGLADIAKRLGLPLGDLPRINTSERGPYQGYYDDELKAAVADIYAGDLLNLNYRF